MKWWKALVENEAMLDAAWLSLRIGSMSATLATMLGLAAGYALARVPRFRGRTLFAGLVIAPMVMPEVVMGISLLLLFVGSDQLFGGPERGFLTITAAHITFSLAFVAIVVQARLADFDRSLEEAAMDLGATPLTTFLTITLPLIAPALASGWLLAFTLSLDDLILTQFVSGAQSQTLPMRVYSSVRLGVDPQDQRARDDRRRHRGGRSRYVRMVNSQASLTSTRVSDEMMVRTTGYGGLDASTEDARRRDCRSSHSGVGIAAIHG